MHSANPAFVTFGLLLYLVILMSISWVINLILKKKIINGAMFFLFLAGILFIINLLPAARSEHAPEAIGSLMGSYFIPVIIGILFMRSFNKKKIITSDNAENENS